MKGIEEPEVAQETYRSFGKISLVIALELLLNQ